MKTMKLIFVVTLVSLVSTFCQTACPLEIVFTKSEQVLGNTRSFMVAIADVDLDGDNDVFLPNYIGPSQLWLNDGDGVFSLSPQSFNLSEVHGVAIRDLNGDTYPDIFLLSHANPSKVYFNNGDGTFTAGAQDIGVGTDYPGTIVLGDVDNDGDVDAFIVYWLVPNRLWLNDGDGFFTITATEYGGGNGGDMQLADVNGDTFYDLFITFSNQPDEIWLNDGSGSFVNSGQALGNSSGYENAASGDVDGDGDIDFAVGNSVDGAKIWLNQNNTGSFVEAGPYFEAGTPKIELLDADLDSDLDLITTQMSGSGNRLWINTGWGTFISTDVLFGSAAVPGLACGRLDGDDDFDVVFGFTENSGGNPIYFNESVDTCCCVGVRGNVNASGIVDLADLSALVSYLTGGGYMLPCSDEASVNGAGIVDLADLSALVSYLTGGGYSLPSCPFVPITVTDIDGNVYQTVTIGTQEWMTQNLKVTHYRNGEAIPNVIDGTTWEGLTTGAYCEYDNDIGDVAAYGRLYNWYAVADSRRLAPTGWHVATDAEWKQLEMHLGMSQADADQMGWRGTSEGGKLKESGTTHWTAPNTGATNESGFTGLPAGYRYIGGLFYDIGIHGVFWSSTENGSAFAWCRNLGNAYSGVHRYDGGKADGFSVRCIKD